MIHGPGQKVRELIGIIQYTLKLIQLEEIIGPWVKMANFDRRWSEPKSTFPNYCWPLNASFPQRCVLFFYKRTFNEVQNTYLWKCVTWLDSHLKNIWKSWNALLKAKKIRKHFLSHVGRFPFVGSTTSNVVTHSVMAYNLLSALWKHVWGDVGGKIL